MSISNVHAVKALFLGAFCKTWKPETKIRIVFKSPEEIANNAALLFKE